MKKFIGGTTAITITYESDLMDPTDRLAAKEQRSRSQVISRLCREALAARGILRPKKRGAE